MNDNRFKVIPTDIIITCRKINSQFERELTDITDFDGYRIYSW